MRKVVILAVVCLLLAGFNWSIAQKEDLRKNGLQVLLPLAPVDPLAPLMGFYMALDFAINADVTRALKATYEQKNGSRGRRGDWSYLHSSWPSSGRAVIRITTEATALNTGRRGALTTPAGTAVFVRLDDGSPLAAKERYLFFRVHGHKAHVASSAFYFQQEHAAAYEKAGYGMLRLDDDGKNLLTHLCDVEGKPISPSSVDRSNAGIQ